MIDAVLSLMDEGYAYVSDKKARELYIRTECKKLDQEISFLSVLKKEGREMGVEYHLALHRYISFDLPVVCDFVAKYGVEEEKEVVSLRVEELRELYQTYFFKNMRLFVVR